jgi:hypothetical protein
MPRPLKRFVRALAALLWASLPSTASADPSPSFAEGLQLFDAGVKYQEKNPSQRAEVSKRFRAAAEAFVRAWRDGALTTEVLTNAANSFFFAGDRGEAVLFYRRALAVDPANDKARSGLERLQSDLPIQPGRSSAASLARSLFFWHQEGTFRWRLAGFCVVFPLGWLLLALEAFRRRRLGRRSSLAYLGAGSLAVGLLLLGSLAYGSLEHPIERDAVVLVEVVGRKGNGENYSHSHHVPGQPEEAASFPPGTELKILERRGTGDRGSGNPAWLRVELRDGKESWVPERTVERVLAKG